MSIPVSTSKAMPVQKADSSNPEISAAPEDFTLADTEETVPLATNHLESLTVFINATGAGDAQIYSRADNAEDWLLLMTINFAGAGDASERFTCPCGQIKVVNNGIALMEVKAQGIGRIQR